MAGETDSSNSSETLPCLFSTFSGSAIVPSANAKRRADERCMVQVRKTEDLRDAKGYRERLTEE